MALRPIFYDTETTGLSPASNHIIEIAAFDPEKDKTFVEFVNPGCPIPKEATAVHKITDEMVASSPDFSVVGSQFADFCSGDTVLVAHNNDNFDLPFLKHEFKKSGLTVPDWKTFDTLKWARKYRPDLPRHPLQFLREIYGIPANTAHRAFDDVIILHKVFIAMTDDLPIETLLQLMEKPQKTTRMPFGKHAGKRLSEVPKSYVSWLRDTGAFDKPDNEELKQSFKEIGLL